MFGREKRLAKIDAKYIAGHPLYAHEKGTDVLFYVDRMQFDNMDVTIPYAAITNLGAQEDRHITKTRVLFTGAIGLFWKKKYRYTVIEYNDGIQDQTLILDFHKEAGKAQKIIYSQMAGARQRQRAESEQKAIAEALTQPVAIAEALTEEKPESEEKALTEEKVFRCYCGESFKTVHELQVHARVHTD